MADAANPIDLPASSPKPAPAERPPKRPCIRPALTDHGTVSALTRGGAGTGADGSPNKKFRVRP